MEFANESLLSVLQRKVLIYFTGVKKAQEATAAGAISHCEAEKEGGFICGEGGKKQLVSILTQMRLFSVWVTFQLSHFSRINENI